MYDPVLKEVRCERRRDEFLETKAQMCVTYCMASCSTFCSCSAGPFPARHVLEYVFGCPVDHEDFAKRAAGIWDGPDSERIRSLFASEDEVSGLKERERS